MPLDLFQTLIAIEGEDGQLKTAAKKLGHEPEMGHMDAGGVTSGLGQAMGRGPMDAKALLDEKALEAAGGELEGRTFQDPRERSGARNLNTKAGPGPVSPTDASRVATKPSNVHLRTGPATHRPDSLAKSAGIKDIASKALAKGRAAASAVGRGAVKKTEETGRQIWTRGAKAWSGKGGKVKRTLGRAAMTVGRGIEKHPRTAMGVAGGAAAAGAGGAAYAVHRHRKHKKAASLSLSQFLDVQAAGDSGIKLATQAYGQEEVLARTIQAREAQSTGMKIACGMFAAAAAQGE